MTTKVTVEAASHRVRVIVRDEHVVGHGERSATETKTVLNPGDAPLIVWATLHRTISINEFEHLAPAADEAKA